VVDRLDPSGKKLVQPLDIFNARLVGFDQELVPDREENRLYLAPALGPARTGVHEPDAQAGTGPQQLGGDKWAPVVQVVPTSAQCRSCRHLGYADT